MGDRMKGKVAFITGGSDGIGRATSIRLAEEGAHVIICARRPENLAEAEAAVKAVLLKHFPGHGFFGESDGIFGTDECRLESRCPFVEVCSDPGAEAVSLFTECKCAEQANALP